MALRNLTWLIKNDMPNKRQQQQMKTLFNNCEICLHSRVCDLVNWTVTKKRKQNQSHSSMNASNAIDLKYPSPVTWCTNHVTHIICICIYKPIHSLLHFYDAQIAHQWSVRPFDETHQITETYLLSWANQLVLMSWMNKAILL